MSVLRKVLDLRPGEARLVAPLMAVALLVLAAQMLATIAAKAVFIPAFSLEQYSEFIIVSSVTQAALTFGYGAVARSRGMRSEHAALVSVALATGVLGALLRVSWHPSLYATCVAVYTMVPVAASEAVSVASEAFPARQGKRLVPLVAGCMSIGTMAGAMVARLFVKRIGTPNLVLIAAALLLCGALVGRLARVHALPREGAPAPVAQTITRVWSIPIVRVAVMFAILVAASKELSDFVFNSALKLRYGRDEDGMAAYVGVFQVALSAGSIVMQLLLTSRITGRFGVRTTLQLHPVALAVAAPVFAFAPSVATATATNFLEGAHAVRRRDADPHAAHRSARHAGAKPGEHARTRPRDPRRRCARGRRTGRVRRAQGPPSRAPRHPAPRDVGAGNAGAAPGAPGVHAGAGALSGRGSPVARRPARAGRGPPNPACARC